MRHFEALSAVAIASCIAAAAPVSAQTTPPAAAVFGARERLRRASLSPDGDKVALIVAGPGRSVSLEIGNLVEGGVPKPVLQTSGDPDQLHSCDWASSTRLICSIVIRQYVGTQRLSFGRLIAINADGSGLKLISARGSSRAMGLMQNGGDLIDWGGDGANGTALVTRQFVPDQSTGSLIVENRRGLAVEMVNTLTLDRKVVEPPREDAVEYISDGHGTVRVMGLRSRSDSGYDGSRIVYLYRKPGSRDWSRLSEVNLAQNSGFDPVTIDRDLNVVYGFERLDGRRALYKVALDGSLKKELVYARPDVDIAGVISVGRHRRVVGASYVTDRRMSEFFDPAFSAQRKALGRALPDRSMTFLDASADEKKLLMFAGSDVDPGTYYLFDKTTRQLAEVAAVRPKLAKLTLAPVKAVTYPAADGTMIPAYLTLPPGASAKGIPAIVMPHGGPGARDEWGFDWLSQFYANRGYAVLQPNFRGSTGYGDAWFQKNGFQSWKTAVGDVNDGGKWLVAQGIADAGKLAIVGWSYGGYAALQSPALDPALFKAIVAVAPVTDLDLLREESRGFTSFLQVDSFIGHGAHVRDGSPARNAGKIKVPVMLFHGTRDDNVGVGESRLMADRIRDAKGRVDYVEFDGLDHYLDDGAARTRLLSESDAFLRKSMGM